MCEFPEWVPEAFVIGKRAVQIVARARRNEPWLFLRRAGTLFTALVCVSLQLWGSVHLLDALASLAREGKTPPALACTTPRDPR